MHDRVRSLVRSAGAMALLLGIAAVADAEPSATFTRPADPWPGPAGPVIYAEGEDFTLDGEGWQPLPVTRDGDGDLSAARMKVLSGRFKGAGQAHRDLAVETAGDYLLHLRLSRWPADSARHRGPLRLQVEQGGSVVFDQTFDETWTGEAPDGRVHLCRLMWESGGAVVPLKPGPATLRLSKVGPEKAIDSARMVDCVLLTTDPKYKPDERDFVPQTYARFHPKSASIPAGYFQIFTTYLRRPWHQHFYADLTGARPGLRGKPANFFTVGETTPWVNLSRFLYNDSPAKMLVRFTAAYASKDAEAAEYAIDFAPRPEESAIVKTVQRAGPYSFMRVVVPPDLTGEDLPKPDYEYAADRLDMVAKLPAITFGRRPEKFPLHIRRPATDESASPGVAQTELKSLAYFNVNSLDGRLSEQDLAHGYRYTTTGQRIWFMGPAGYNEPLLDKMESFIKDGARDLADKSHADRIHAIRLMDEAGAKALSSMVGNAIDEAAFRAWLAERQLTPAALGLASIDDIHLTDDRNAAPPSLYYWSQRFRAFSVARFFRHATELIDKHYPPGLSRHTTQNYSDGAVYAANMYSQGNDYYTWFKDVQALGTAHSEDWTNQGATWQLCGWNVNLLRSATKYHHQPIAMYVISSFGRRPLDVKLKSLSNIAGGAKTLSYYDYTPEYSTNSSVFGGRPEIFVAIAEVAREIGAAEDILVDAMPRPARTAILYSIPYDIWNVGDDNVLGHERMFTYLALRHSQAAVDIISDDDVHEIGLAGFDVVYAFGEQIDRRAVAPLAAWVKAGGTLVLSPDAVSRDELNQPLADLDQALGLTREPAKVLQKISHSSRYVCTLAKPAGVVKLGDDAGQSTLFARSQTFPSPDGSQILARFEDGSPAALRVNVDKGRVFMHGFLPGLAYMQRAYQHYAVGGEVDRATAGPLMEEDLSNKAAAGPAAEEMVQPLRNVALAMAATSSDPAMRDANAIRIPRNQYSFCPFAYPPALRDFIVAPLAAAKVTQPVAVDKPVVEATFMESDKGWVVPLANYTGNPLERINVTIRPGRRTGLVYSSREGQLTTGPSTGEIHVAVPLESTDFLYANWLE